MNIGDCPYEGCNGVFMQELPEKTPSFAKLECDECKRPVWYKFSRVDPECWTEEGFLEDFEVNEETKTINKRIPGLVRAFK